MEPQRASPLSGSMHSRACWISLISGIPLSSISLGLSGTGRIRVGRSCNSFLFCIWGNPLSLGQLKRSKDKSKTASKIKLTAQDPNTALILMT